MRSPGALLPGVRRIAVLRPNAVGDFVFALPCLHALKAAYPEARITYLGKPWHADFLAGRPGPVDEAVVVPPCPGVGAPPDAPPSDEACRFLDAMRDARFDLALQVYGGGGHSNPLVRQFGARTAIGLRAPDAPPLDRSVRYGELQNRRLQLLEVAALAGADRLPLAQELCVTERDRAEAKREVPDTAGRPLVVIQPGATDARRRWPAERFAAVADALAQRGAAVAVNGTQEEGGVVRAVLERMREPAIDLTGRLSLSGLCGLLERAALLVSNDTGPLHLGLAVGTPCVGIYWLTNLIESGPLRQDGHRPALSLQTRCPVCGVENLRTRCAHDESFVAGVPTEEVMAYALDLFAQPASAPSEAAAQRR